ncbi:FAD-dependent monooxygenase [Aliidiomarina soli]|uniref:2-octaprenyl-6-methoxyphenyl hydroxylase n=1 Tax=Aliidiomarina soli TaxID=1928574 RepID=A0A432WED2_9GAMM|nr:FAD-dependent monooxygenase [Aliidiomarina soli]RUO31226.1 2-octaprenyl-6-methoxyphenyl hydroxylase [Aliidiomarina soli]
MSANSVDITISGGGVVGGLAALLLAKAMPDRSILVLDGSAPGSHDPRTLALAHTTVLAMQQAGLWSPVAALKGKAKETSEPAGQAQRLAQAIQHIHVSERGAAGSSSLHAADFNLDALGQVVPAQALQQDVHAACQQVENLTWLDNTALSAFEHQRDNVVLTAGQQTLHSQLLIAADGGRSMIRDQLAIQGRETDYQQTALIANVTFDRDHQGMAYERFTEHGPIALLPCGPRRMALVWCVAGSDADYYNTLSDEDFLRALQQEFGYRAGRCIGLDTRASYPLYLLLADRAVYHRTVLLGNACHTLHPIAGQGYNLGVRDVLDLVEALSADHDPAQPGWSHQTLLAYERRRQQDYQRIGGLTDGLVRTFSNHYPPLRAARNMGLLALRSCKPLAYPLARAAMGYRSLTGD